MFLNVAKGVLGGFVKPGFVIMVLVWVLNTHFVPAALIEIIIALIGLGLYGALSWRSSNRANNHPRPRVSERDIVGDLFVVLTIYGISLFWLFYPNFLGKVVEGWGYYITLIFFVGMTMISVFEMIMTVHNSLINMYRKTTIEDDPNTTDT